MERALAIAAAHGGDCREGARYRDDEPGAQARSGGAAEQLARGLPRAPRTCRAPS